MENWGLVVYVESLFLYNVNYTQTSEYNVVTVVVHETAHQWTGNIVTMKW